MKDYINLNYIINIKQGYIHTILNCIPAIIILALGFFMEIKLMVKYASGISLVICISILFISQHTLCKKVKKGIKKELINKYSTIIKIQSMENGEYFQKIKDYYVFKVYNDIIKIPEDNVDIIEENVKDNIPVLEHIIKTYVVEPNDSKYGKYIEKGTSEVNYYNLYVHKIH